MQGKFVGIGVTFLMHQDSVAITGVIEGGPSEKAGLKAGDKLIAVDGKSAEKKTAEEVNEILKGYPGTEVELTIERPGEPKELKINLVRDEVQVPNVPYSGDRRSGVVVIHPTDPTFCRGHGFVNCRRRTGRVWYTRNPERCRFFLWRR